MRAIDTSARGSFDVPDRHRPLRSDDKLAAIWIGAAILMAFVLVVIPEQFPERVTFNYVASMFVLTLSASTHIFTAVWVRQRAPSAKESRIVGFSNGCMGVLMIAAIWLLHTHVMKS